jgi:hypothetical protein
MLKIFLQYQAISWIINVSLVLAVTRTLICNAKQKSRNYQVGKLYKERIIIHLEYNVSVTILYFLNSCSPV